MDTETDKSSFAKRFLAYAIDMLFISVCGNIIRIFYDPPWGSLVIYENETADFKLNFPVLLLTLQVLYFGLLEGSSLQATFGKIAMSLKVTGEKGEKINPATAMLRNIARIASILPAFAGYFMYFIGDKKQCLHDSIASTIVVDKPRVTET
jgi:uncharacterized RDD family membrane protein YckC